MIKKCAFTGHRDVRAAHLAALPGVLARAIEYAYSEGCREFLSGGALGFDTYAAREVIRFRMSHPDVRLIMLLPCRDQDKMWTERQRSSYSYVLSLADELIYVGDDYSSACMRARNVRLAEECDILIAYLSRWASGAGQTVRLAEGLGKKVYNIYHRLNGADNAPS